MSRPFLFFPPQYLFLFYIVLSVLSLISANEGKTEAVEVAGETRTFATFNSSSIVEYALSSPDRQYVYVVGETFHTITRLSASNSSDRTIVAGQSGTEGFADGPLGTNLLNSPGAIAFDPKNQNILYIADYSNARVRKLDLSTGMLSTLAGSGVVNQLDGIGTNAQFTSPGGLVCVGAFIFLTDQNAIRKIDLTSGVNYGAVTTVAGVLNPRSGETNFQDGIGFDARFYNPQGITASPDGLFLYIADASNHRIRRIEISTASVTTIVGIMGYSDGNFSVARFLFPTGITVDDSGDFLYVTDYKNNCIRRIALCNNNTGSQFVETLAGLGPSNNYKGFVDAIGTNARFDVPSGISYQSADLFEIPHLLVTDVNNHAIRRIAIPYSPEVCSSSVPATTPSPPPITMTSTSPQPATIPSSASREPGLSLAHIFFFFGSFVFSFYFVLF